MKRNSKLKVSLISNLTIKFFSILISFILVPVLISYLGTEKYGVWLTIYSVINWLVIFDLGLGNGLKLNLTRSLSLNRKDESSSLISTSYYLIGLISTIGLVIFFLCNFFIDWGDLLNIKNTTDIEVEYAVIILFLLFFITLTVKLIGVIYASFQKPHINFFLVALSQLFFLLGIYLLVYFKVESSLVLVAIYSTLPLVLIYLVLNIHFFFIKAPYFKLSYSLVSKLQFHKILSPGIGFFIIQISSVILYSTDNLIISYFISPEEVTNYNISYKYFGIPFMIYTLYISTHWPSFIDAINKNDMVWLIKKINYFRKLFLSLIVVYVFAFFLYDILVPIWIKSDNIKLDFKLNLAMIFYYLISSYTTIYIYVINASGKIAIQKYLYVIIAIINIPMSAFFIKQFNLGSVGVILASAICLLLLIVFIPIQSNKIINNRATGIWGK